jgi:hypothetical protein
MLHEHIYSAYELLDRQIEEAKSSKCCMHATQAFGDAAGHS